MGVLKGLFVGVYASSRAIRSLFLPICYLLLSTPFLLLVLYSFRVDIKALVNFGNHRSPADIFLQLFVSAVAFLLPTRIISGKDWSTSKDAGKRRVQQLPYWIPGARHWGSIVFGGDKWLKGVRESSITPIIAYNAAGGKHNVVLSATLLDQLLKDNDNYDEAEISRWAFLKNAYNMPKNAKSQFMELRPTIAKALQDELFKGRQMEKVLSSSLSILSDTLPDLMTFNSSIVDQMSWERVAGVELTNETVEAECDLIALINEFFCNAIIPSITGPQFPESYQLLASDLYTFNQYYYALALGLPRLVPVRGLPTGMLAKKRLLQNFDRLFDELTNPPKKRVPDDDESLSGEETDADTPTPLTALNELFTKHDLPIQARTAITLQLIVDITSELVPLALWTIIHIQKSAATAKSQGAVETLIDEIRKETKIWVEGIQPPSIHPSFPAPPEISFNGTPRVVSSTSFPHLRSSINEARRFYKASTKTLKVTKPTTLTETESIRPGIQEQWELDVGSYVDIGVSEMLFNTSSANFLSPDEFKPDRFLHNAPPSSVTCPSDPQEPLASALLIALVAGILQLWEIAPAPKKTVTDHWQEAQAAAAGEKYIPAQKTGTWIIPKAIDGATVKIPKGEVRVRIRRREGLAERRSLRKGR